MKTCHFTTFSIYIVDYRVSLMTSCWYEDSEERPSFDELATELEKVLSIMVGYVELNMELVAITEDEHGKHSDIVHSELGDTVL